MEFMNTSIHDYTIIKITPNDGSRRARKVQDSVANDFRTKLYVLSTNSKMKFEKISVQLFDRLQYTDV